MVEELNVGGTTKNKSSLWQGEGFEPRPSGVEGTKRDEGGGVGLNYIIPHSPLEHFLPP